MAKDKGNKDVAQQNTEEAAKASNSELVEKRRNKDGIPFFFPDHNVTVYADDMESAKVKLKQHLKDDGKENK